jgi:flagellar basal-body rod protein FlgC
MSLNTALKVSSTGLSVERFKMDIISSNIANANSMKIGNKDPYRRHVVDVTGDENGVQVSGISQDQAPFRKVQDPNNPNADGDGNVTYSNIEPISEMVNMLSASRAYEANIAAFNSAKGMIKDALTIGK